MPVPDRVRPLRPELVYIRPSGGGFRWNLRRAILLAILLPVAIALIVSWANTIHPAGIVIHHTGPFGNGDPITLASLDEFHEHRGFGAFYYGHVYHIAYHYIVFPDGHIVAGRPEHLHGAHTKHYNNFLGIVLVGDFSRMDNPRGLHGLEQPTEPQLSALVLLCRRLVREYGIPLDRVYPHRELGKTLCPGNRFPWADFVSRIPVEPQPHSPPLK